MLCSIFFIKVVAAILHCQKTLVCVECAQKKKRDSLPDKREGEMSLETTTTTGQCLVDNDLVSKLNEEMFFYRSSNLTSSLS
jgi:hypothetical protein